MEAPDWQKVYFEIVRIVSLSHDSEKPFDGVLELLHLAIPFESASLFMINPVSGELEQLAEKGQKVDLADGFHFGGGKGLSSWVLQRKQPLLLGKVRKGEEFGSGDIHSVMLIPILDKDESIGVIGFGHSLEDAFDEENLKLAKLTGETIAGLIIKMRAKEEIRQLNVELQRKNQELKALQNKLIKQERLAAIGQISNTIAHALNNPLTAAFWQLELLEQKIVDISANDVYGDIYRLKESLYRISDEVKKLTAIENDRIDSTSPNGLEMIDL